MVDANVDISGMPEPGTIGLDPAKQTDPADGIPEPANLYQQHYGDAPRTKEALDEFMAHPPEKLHTPTMREAASMATGIPRTIAGYAAAVPAAVTSLATHAIGGVGGLVAGALHPELIPALESKTNDKAKEWSSDIYDAANKLSDYFVHPTAKGKEFSEAAMAVPGNAFKDTVGTLAKRVLPDNAYQAVSDVGQDFGADLPALGAMPMVRGITKGVKTVLPKPAPVPEAPLVPPVGKPITGDSLRAQPNPIPPPAGTVAAAKAEAAQAPPAAPPEAAPPANGNPVTQRFAAQLSDHDASRAAYESNPHSDGGRILNTDTARELSPDYMADRTLSADVHEPASAFIKKLYADKLQEPAGPGETPTVQFTAGGTGAGKSTAPEIDGPKPQIVYDTNMNKFESADAKMQQALKAGKNVNVNYTYRDPVDALVNGALPRAMRQEARFGTGRTVPIEEHLKTHVGANETVRALADKYKNDPRVDISAVDNNYGKGNSKRVSLDQVPDITGNTEQLRGRLHDALDQELAAGRISQSVYEGFTRKTGEAGSTTAVNDGGIGGRNPSMEGAGLAREGSTARGGAEQGGAGGQRNLVDPNQRGSVRLFNSPADEGPKETPAPEQQSARAAHLDAIDKLSGGLLPTRRLSALTGDYNATGDDFQAKEVGSAVMRKQIASENNALHTATDKVHGSIGSEFPNSVDSTTLGDRGRVTRNAIQGIEQHFGDATDNLYGTAREQNQGRPIPKLQRVHDYLNDDSNFTNDAEIGLQRAAKQRLERLWSTGDPDKGAPPGSVNAAERFREFINEKYSYQNGGVSKALKNATDMDVAEHGGPGLFEAARAMRQHSAQMLEEPTGIRKLLTPSDSQGINHAIPEHKVMDYIADLPREQHEHVLNVLRAGAHLSPELAESSAAALREIQAHTVSRIHAAATNADGSWNARKFYNSADKYARNSPETFKDRPDVLNNLQTINDAGNTLNMDKHYPGATAQAARTGVLGHAIEAGGQVIASAAHEIPLVGRYIGRKIEHAVDNSSGKISDNATERAVSKRLVDRNGK